MVFKIAEQVSPAHPDKLADRIADAILDAYIAEDPDTKAGIEVMVKDKKVIIAGEVTSDANTPNYKSIVQEVISQVGYAYDAEVVCSITEQSPELKDSKGANDQTIVHGYYTAHKYSGIPEAQFIANMIMQEHADVRRYLNIGADAKVLVNLDCNYVKMNLQVDDEGVLKYCNKFIEDVLLEWGYRGLTVYVNNRTQWRITDHPYGDTGLTGRKLVCDAYGPTCPIGGGAFSGKDPSKLDRSGAYMARYLAMWLNKVKGIPDPLVTLSWGKGELLPVVRVSSIITTPDTSYLYKEFDLSTEGIIKFLDLKRPIYTQTSSLGHFGKPELPWETLK